MPVYKISLSSVSAIIGADTDDEVAANVLNDILLSDNSPLSFYAIGDDELAKLAAELDANPPAAAAAVTTPAAAAAASSSTTAPSGTTTPPTPVTSAPPQPALAIIAPPAAPAATGSK